MIIMKTADGRSCRRCAGTGEFAGGMCFNCHGSGLPDHTPKTAPHHSISGARRMAVIDAIRARATDLDGHCNGEIESETSWARGLLEDREPARFELLVASVEAGRIDAVIEALREYHHQHATEA